MKNTIITYSKIRFNPLEPKEEDICIEDIAHALSMMTRANGHFPEFYSVAQHCINCCKEALSRSYTEEVALACLLHDGSEAYLSDVTRPIKRQLTQYQEIEDRMQSLIYQKYLCRAPTEKEEKQVKKIDDALLYHEFMNYMYEPMREEEPIIIHTPEFQVMPIDKVEREYIRLFRRLLHSINGESESYFSVGVDVCRGRWLSVALKGLSYHIQIDDEIKKVCKIYQEADSILADIPIGLPEDENEEYYRPDAEVRKLMKKKSASVFPVPCRQAVYENDENMIKEKNKEILGKSLSKQSLAIIPRIREVDRFLRNDDSWNGKLEESHPEFCFAMLNGGEPILERKIEQAGIDKRIEVLEMYYSPTKEVVETYMEMGLPKSGINDLLDALCLAVVGQLGYLISSRTVPAVPKRDQKGIYMQIVYPDTCDIYNLNKQEVL